MMLSFVLLFLRFLVIIVADEILELVFHFLEEGHDFSEVGAGFSRQNSTFKCYDAIDVA